MGDFFSGLKIQDVLAATREYQALRHENRLAELAIQARLMSAAPGTLSNPNAQSNPASQTSAPSFMARHGVMIAVVAVVGLVAWKVLR